MRTATNLEVRSALLVVVAASQAHAQVPREASLGGGRVDGVGPGTQLDGHTARVAIAWRPIEALSVGPELSLVQLSGQRDGIATAARGAALIGVLRWHALRSAYGSAYVTLGWGGIAYDTPFPPRGTRLNGTSMSGGGVAVRVAPGADVRCELRQLHSSNGKGIVEGNPAFDGIELGLHLQVRL